MVIACMPPTTLYIKRFWIEQGYYIINGYIWSYTAAVRGADQRLVCRVAVALSLYLGGLRLITTMSCRWIVGTDLFT